MTTNQHQEILRTEGLSKFFPGVKALDNVDFSLRRGEIMALLVISSELEELVGYADRVIIMRDRKQVAEIPLAELSVPAIMNAIAA